MEKAKFDARKKTTLSNLILTAAPSSEEDKSRAGRVDERARDFVQAVNERENIFTTSSCSGRISVFAERTEEDVKEHRKGGEWVFVSHELVEDDASSMIEKIRESLKSNGARIGVGERGKTLTLRFEPFILAVETKDERTAQMFVKCARDAGYRESGVVSTMHNDENSDSIASGSGRITASARCSIRMETLVAKDGEMLLSDEGLRILVEECNKKMKANWERSDRFLTLFTERFCDQKKTNGVALKNENNTSISGNSDGSNSGATKKAKQCWLLVDSLCAKTCKDALKRNGWLDQSRKSVSASIEEAQRRHLVVDNPTSEEMIPASSISSTTLHVADNKRFTPESSRPHGRWRE